MLLSFTVATPVLAEWPNQPITIIVPFAAGGGTDQTARILQPLLQREIGQTVIVQNRVGAAGEVGLSALAASKPDGYTIGILNIPPVLTIPLAKQTSFTIEDFTPIANLTSDPSAISVPANSPFETLADLVAYAKKNPGAVTVATTGVGTDDHLALAYLAKAADIELTHVPFSGSAPARTALLGGHVSAAAINLGENMPYVEQKQVRVLAHFGRERSSLAPDVPTVADSGYDVFMNSEHAVGAPAGMDPQVVERIAKAVEAAAKDPSFVQANTTRYTETKYIAPEQFQPYIKSLQNDYKTMWEQSPWE